MILMIIIIITTVCLLSSLLIYTLINSRENFKLSAINQKQKIRYFIRPSIDIITRKLHDESPHRFSISSLKRHHHRRCSSTRNSTQEKQINLINTNPRSHSLANNLCVLKPINRGRSSIVDSNQIAQIEFSLPPTKEKYRRRSVAICNNIIGCKQSTIDSIIRTIKSSNQFLPCLLTFSINYLKSSQIKIHFHSLTSLPSTIHLQQLTIKVKLIPDGKIKYLYIKKILDNENIFSKDDGTHDYFVRFSNISFAKLHDKAILMKIYGKDQTKKSIDLGQIGKIYFNQIKNWENENQMDFVHEIEKIKTSSAEILVSLQQNEDHHLIVDIQRIKGLKIDQKNLSATYYFRAILLDRHRPLSTHQTKSYRLNSSIFSFHEPLDFNILAFNSNNLDRLMIIIDLYSNATNPIEHRCIARVKLASPYFCSGIGTNHWQEFKERQSFSMWHTLIKQQ